MFCTEMIYCSLVKKDSKILFHHLLIEKGCKSNFSIQTFSVESIYLHTDTDMTQSQKTQAIKMNAMYVLHELQWKVVDGRSREYYFSFAYRTVRKSNLPLLQTCF